MSSMVFERFLSTPDMVEAFGEVAIVQGMLDFEAALARAQAAAGVIPASAGETIAGACRVEGFDLNAIVAYLRSLPPVRNVLPAPVYRMPVRHTAYAEADRGFTDKDMHDKQRRGAYLATIGQKVGSR